MGHLEMKTMGLTLELRLALLLAASADCCTPKTHMRSFEYGEEGHVDRSLERQL